MSYQLIQTPTIQVQDVQQKKPKRNDISPGMIWTIAVIIIVITIVVAIFLISSQGRDVVEIPFAEDIVVLDELIDLETSLCCLPPSAVTPTARWVYLPSNDTTFSLDETSPDVVCQNEMGSNYDACINLVTDENNNPTVLAHKGIELYYAFSPGQATSVCSSFVPCV